MVNEDCKKSEKSKSVEFGKVKALRRLWREVAGARQRRVIVRRTARERQPPALLPRAILSA